MKILRLLNKKNFSIILALLFTIASYAEEQPVDIWNIDTKNIESNSPKSEINDSENGQIKLNTESEIYKMQSQKNNNLIKLDEDLKTKEIKILS